MASLDVAIKTQRTKHALLWLTQAQDKYFGAWSAWSYQGRPTNSSLVLHCRTQAAGASSCFGAPSPNTWVPDVDKLLHPTVKQATILSERVRTYYHPVLHGASSWWEEEEWVLSYHHHFPAGLPALDPQQCALHRFWGTLGWSNNPWIQDGKGLPLQSSTYDRIAICPISDLHIRRTGPTEFIFRIKPVGHRSIHHSQPKHRR